MLSVLDILAIVAYTDIGRNDVLYVKLGDIQNEFTENYIAKKR